MIKRLIFCITALSLQFLLSGCADDSGAVKLVKTWENVDEQQLAEEDRAQSDVLSEVALVGMVTDVGGINDQSFNQSAWEGLQVLSENSLARVTYRESASEEDFEENFKSLTDEGCNLCWGVGFACADAVEKAAKANPDTHYAIIDNAFEDPAENLTGVVFRAEEPSFLVGFIAGACTNTGRLGFVGGVRGEIIDQFEYGFRAGAEYASKVYGRHIDISVEYADSFTDVDKGYALASKMYDSGCDIIYAAAGASGLGVIDSAKGRNRYVIGVDRDQSYLAPDNVLTSALKLVNVAVARVSEGYLSGDDIGGENMSFGLNEGAVGIPEEHKNFSDEIYDMALIIADKIKSGEIDPPASEAEYAGFIESQK